MDSPRDDGRAPSPDTHAGRPAGGDHSTTTRLTGYRTEVGHYRRPLLGVPWIVGLILVPALLAGIGLATRPASGVAAQPSAQASTPAASASAAPSGTSASPSASVPAAPANAVLELSQVGSTLTLSGVVADAATQAAVVKATRDAYGTGVTVINQIKVASGAPAVDPAAFGTIAGQLKGLSGVIFDAGANQVKVSGVAPTDAVKASALDAIKAAYPGATIDSTGLVVGSTTTPPATCAETAAYVTALTTETKIQFTTGGTSLTPASQAALGKIASAVVKCPTVKLQVAGNTDNVGGTAANQALSLVRAGVVKALLVNQGIPEASITAVGNGETKPIASNSTAAGQATNRRVDITVQ